MGTRDLWEGAVLTWDSRLPYPLCMIFRQDDQVKTCLTKSLRTVVLTCDGQVNVPQKYVTGVRGTKTARTFVFVFPWTAHKNHWFNRTLTHWKTIIDHWRWLHSLLPLGRLKLWIWPKPYAQGKLFKGNPTEVLSHHCSPWAMAHLPPACSQKAKILHLHLSLQPSIISHSHPLSLLVGLMGGLHLPALSWLLLRGKEAHPDGFQQFSWVFYGLLLIYSQFSILVNGHKLDWSHKS